MLDSNEVTDEDGLVRASGDEKGQRSNVGTLMIFIEFELNTFFLYIFDLAPPGERATTLDFNEIAWQGSSGPAPKVLVSNRGQLQVLPQDNR